MTTLKLLQLKRWRHWAPIGSMTMGATILPPIGGILILAALPLIGPWLQALHWVGMVLYILAFVIFAGLALLPTYAQAILGGWAFGFGWGFFAAMIGFAGASLLAHYLASWIAGRRLVEAIERRPRWRRVHQALATSGFWRTTFLVILLRIPPTSPFALTNVLLASTRISWLPCFIGTVIGLAPRTAVAVFAAAQVAGLNLDPDNLEASDSTVFFSIGSTVLAIVVLGIIARRTLRRAVSASIDPA